MIVLGIEGALGLFSVAVVRDEEVLAVTAIPGTSALEGGLEAIAGTLREAGIDPTPSAASKGLALDRIGVGVGPGRFTGLRIAISYAKSLAQAWKVPVVGISSAELVSQGVFSRLGERDFTVESLDPPIQTPALAVALLASSREPAASLHEVRADYGNHTGPKVPNLRPPIR